MLASNPRHKNQLNSVHISELLPMKRPKVIHLVPRQTNALCVKDLRIGRDLNSVFRMGFQP